MVSSSRFPVPSPGQRFPGPPMGPGPGPGRPSSTGGMSPMHDAPLNPSAASTMGRGFDPISSMAQMSQQLTSTSSANAGPPGGPPDLCNMDAGMMQMGRPNGMMGGPPPDMMGPGGPGDMGM